MRIFNHCIFVGHAGSEPKLLTTDSGKTFTKFLLAVANYSSDERSEPLWLTVLVWKEELAASVAKLIKTGALILASGRLSLRPYTDGAGVDRTDIELIASQIELLEKAAARAAPTKAAPAQHKTTAVSDQAA